MEQKSYQNYLFDLYGTLADIHTDESSLSFWKSCCRLLGMKGARYTPKELKAKYAAGIARLDAQAREALGPEAEPEIDLAPVFRSFWEDRGLEVSEEAVAEFAMVFRTLSLKKLRLFPGVKRMLAQLHTSGKKVYLLSNAQALFTRPELELLGLTPYFDGILLSSEAGRKKPDPEFYRALMDTYGLNPEETVMVGNDDIADCHGAAAAGLDSFYVFTQQSPQPRKPLPENCRKLNKIADLTDFVIAQER